MCKNDPVGFFGGTFNPVHRGHIETVRVIKSSLGIATLHVTPVNMPSHRAAPGVTGSKRLAMVELALAGVDEPGFIADSRELDRDGPSYTFDSLQELRALYGTDRSLILILGLDSFISLPTWYRWDELLDLAHIAVMNRPGSRAPEPLPPWWEAPLVTDINELKHCPAGCIVHVEAPLLDISSTAIRRRLGEGDVPHDWLDPAVIEYINTHNLYMTTPSHHRTADNRDEETTDVTAQVPDSSAGENDNSYAERVRGVVVDAMDDAKAQDISALDVRDMTDVTDFMVIATGTSDRHLRAVADSVRTGLRDAGLKPVGSEGDDGGEWILIDCGPVVAHIMRREAREFYDLDGLWSEEVRDLIRAQRDGEVDQ